MAIDALLEKLIKNFPRTKIEELNNLPYGILETEQMTLIYFLLENALVPLCTVNNIPYKPILKNIFQYIVALQFDDINKLFNINKYKFDVFIHSRILHYKKLYNSNKTTTSTKDKLVYTAVSYLYVLSADKCIFETNKEPFADEKLIQKESVRIRNDNYQKYGDLDKYFIEYYSIFGILYELTNNIAEEIVKNIQHEIKKTEEQKNINVKELYNIDPDKPKTNEGFEFAMFFIAVVFIFLLISFGISIHDSHKQQQRAEEISQTENLIIKYQHEHNPLYNDMIKRLSELTGRSTESIKQEYETTFNNEKKDIIKQIIDTMVEKNIYDETLKTRCLTIYFYNDEKEMNDAIKQTFIERKDEITKNIAKNWEQTGKIDEELKKKYISSLFNNNVNEFNKAMDKALGYKEFTLIPIPQQTKIMSDNTIHTNYDGAIYVAAYTNDLYLKIYNPHGNCITAFIKKDDAIGIPVSPNNYKIEFYYGPNWYGTKYLFGKHTKKSETSQNAVISNYKSLYFDDSNMLSPDLENCYNLKDANMWYERRRANAQRIERESDPNRNLKVNNLNP